MRRMQTGGKKRPGVALRFGRLSKRRAIGRAMAGWGVTVVFLLPVVALVATSLKSENAAYGKGFFLHFSPTFGQYAHVFSGQYQFVQYLLNSLMVSLGSALVVTVLATMACYALVFGRVRRVTDVLFFFVSTKALPVAASVIPLYLLIKNLRLLNEPWVLGVLYVGFNLPIAIWIIWSSMKDIPRDIIEAGWVDGATPSRLMWSVIVRIAAGGIASAWLLSVVFAWSEFLFALSLTTTNSTLPVFLQQFQSYGTPYIALLSAASVVISVPPVVAGWLSMRYLIHSFAGSGK